MPSPTSSLTKDLISELDSERKVSIFFEGSFTKGCFKRLISANCLLSFPSTIFSKISFGLSVFSTCDLNISLSFSMNSLSKSSGDKTIGLVAAICIEISLATASLPEISETPDAIFLFE